MTTDTATAPSVDIIEGRDAAGIADWLSWGILNACDRAGSGNVAIAVPGGSTPFPIFAELAGHELPWGRLTFWLTDDRVVAEDHPASNVGKLRPIIEPKGAKVHALAEGDAPPHFALVWLGMGADGHIASLFPNTDPQLSAPSTVIRLTPDPLPPEAPFDRLSLTLPSLLDSDAMMLVMTGADKRRVLDAAIVGAHDLPIARLLRAARQPVTLFWSA